MVETLGIERSYQAMADADLTLLRVRSFPGNDERRIASLSKRCRIAVRCWSAIRRI